MRAPLSIIVPTLNAETALPATFASLIEGLECSLVRELIISDGGSVDATLDVAQASGAMTVVGKAGRGGQLRRGKELAGGDWLLFLHGDTSLSKGWSAEVLSHIRGSDNAAFFQLKFRAPGILPAVFAKGANIRSRFGLPYGDQGLLIRADLYDSIGGYADIALMEDVEIARKLRGKLVGLSAFAETSAERYQRKGWFRSGITNIRTLAAYLAGADPEALAKRYYR